MNPGIFPPIHREIPYQIEATPDICFSIYIAQKLSLGTFEFSCGIR